MSEKDREKENQYCDWKVADWVKKLITNKMRLTEYMDLNE